MTRIRNYWGNTGIETCYIYVTLTLFTSYICFIHLDSRYELPLLHLNLYSFCDYLKDTEKVGLLQPQHLQAMVTGLISLATKYTDSVLAITLDTLVIVVKVSIKSKHLNFINVKYSKLIRLGSFFLLFYFYATQCTQRAL